MQNLTLLSIEIFEQLVKASTSMRPSGDFTPMSFKDQAIRFLLYAAWGAGGSTIFYTTVLAKLLPMLVPRLRFWLGTDGYFIVDMIAGFSSVGTDRAPGGPDASSWASDVLVSTADAIANKDVPIGNENLTSRDYKLSAVDSDTCCFLFLLFGTQLTAVAALLSANIPRGIGVLCPTHHVTLAVIQCLLAMFFISLACNGLVGGLEQGADPMACLATLIFAVLYFLVGGCCILYPISPHP